MDSLHCRIKNNNRTMYKSLALIIFVLIGTTCASSSFNDKLKSFQHLNSNVNENNIGIDLCPECIQESVTIINILLNLILDEGIIQSCTALCGALANKTDVIVGDLCDVACEALGIDEFVKALVKADLDPIYYCELIDLCPSKKKNFLSSIFLKVSIKIFFRFLS